MKSRISSKVVGTMRGSSVRTAEPCRIEVTLLDRDHLPLARGTAILPELVGAGTFFPTSPMPAELGTARCFQLPTGETMNVGSILLKVATPPCYKFQIESP